MQIRGNGRLEFSPSTHGLWQKSYSSGCEYMFNPALSGYDIPRKLDLDPVCRHL
jgi:hypothetical protein